MNRTENARCFADHAFTVGGGFTTNPGRYLVLLPPVQTTPGGGALGGATPANNSCTGCFSRNRGDHFHAWDFTVGYDYRPEPLVTFRAEFNHRAADVPYFAGQGGVTGEDGTNNNNTGANTASWTPDFAPLENRMNLAMMVRF